MVEKAWDVPDIFRIYVSLPDNPLKNLNSYVLRTAEASLIIDTWFNRPECWEALWSGIEELGLDLSRMRLFLTHLYSDWQKRKSWKGVAACLEAPTVETIWTAHT